MNGKISKTIPILLSAGLLAFVLLSSAPVHAQFFDETLEQDDLFSKDDDQFFEPRGDDLGEPSQEKDFTEGNKFVDDTLAPGEQGGVTAKDRRFQLTLKDDRNDLPLNIAWGAGTGLLLGGWYALINEGDNRETQRSIGMGVVLGLIAGTLIGTRSVFAPDAARPVGKNGPSSREKTNFIPLVMWNAKHAVVGFQLRF
jgi:hypothetical protein